MKNLQYIFLIFIGINVSAQVAIGKPIDNNSAILDFANTGDRGILLPVVNSIDASRTPETPGTILLDATNSNTAQFKLRNNTTWVTYSRNTGNASSIINNRPTTPDLDNTTKFIIGNNTSTAVGALIIESTTKALALPIVQSTDDIVNPSPGMMVFVKTNRCTSYTIPCVDEYLGFFNGTEWAYWEYGTPIISIDPPLPEPCTNIDPITEWCLD